MRSHTIYLASFIALSLLGACKEHTVTAPAAATQLARATEDEDDPPIYTDFVVFHLGDAPVDASGLAKKLLAENPSFGLELWPDEEHPGKTPGLTVRALTSKQMPPPSRDLLQHFGFGLDEATVDRLLKSKRSTAITLWTRNSDRFRGIHGGEKFALAFAEATDGALTDYQSRRTFSTGEWKATLLETWTGDIPEAAKQIAIHFYAENGSGYRSITVGMTKFGLPDLVVEDHPASLAQEVGALLRASTQTMVEAPERVDPLHFKIDPAQLHRGVLGANGEPPLGPSHSVTLSLKSVKPKEGDSDRVVQLSLRTPEEIVAAYAALFGTKPDHIRSALSGDQELLAASQRARQRFLAARSRFPSRTERLEIWRVKAGFPVKGGGTEYLWFEVRDWKDGKVSGPLTSKADFVPLKKGETVAIPETAVYDFAVFGPKGDLEGAETDAILEAREGDQHR